MENDVKVETEPDKKPRKKRSDAGKPKPKPRTLDAIKADIMDLVDEALEMQKAAAKVSWE
jgi:hypothetical protein